MPPAAKKQKWKHDHSQDRSASGVRGQVKVTVRGQVKASARGRGGRVQLVGVPRGKGKAAAAAQPAQSQAGCPPSHEHLHNNVPVDERVVMWLGDGRLSRHSKLRSCEEVPEDLLPRRRGHRPLALRWRRAPGFLMFQHGFCGGNDDAWAAMLSTVTHIRDSGEVPDFILLTVGAGALVDRPAAAEGTLRPHARVREAAEYVSSGLHNWLCVLRAMMPYTCPVVLAVVPEPGPAMTGAARALTAALRQTARQQEALFVDVEEVVCRHIAATAPSGAAGPNGRPPPAPVPVPPVQIPPAPAPAAPAPPLPRGDGVVTESRLREVREELRQQLRLELRHELLQELRQELERDEWKPKQEPSDDAADDVQAADGDAEPSSSSAGGAGPERGGARPCAAADVPWVSGWVPGCPPPVSLHAPPLPPRAFTESGGLSTECCLAIKRELMCIILS